MQGTVAFNRVAPCCSHKRRRCVLRVSAHAPPTAGSTAGAAKKDFLGRLRQAAIKLHTPEQLNPNKSKKAEVVAEKPAQRPPFTPKVAGYLKYLTESKAVFDTLERIVAESSDPSLAPFKHTGLERGPALEADLRWFAEEKGRTPAPLKPDGPGLTYARRLEELASTDLPAFMCHYYNVYFAHTAGGAMIGKAVSNAVLDGAELQFYQYGGADSKEIGLPVKDAINAMAESWSEDETARAVEQTGACFTYAGSMMRCITQSCDCDCVKE